MFISFHLELMLDFTFIIYRTTMSHIVVNTLHYWHSYKFVIYHALYTMLRHMTHDVDTHDILLCPLHTC